MLKNYSLTNCLRISGLGATMAMLSASAVLAGSLNPPVEDVIVMPAAVSTNHWTGPYVGGSLGYAFGGDDRVGLWDPTTGAWQASAGKLEHDGLYGRVRVGLRWELAQGTILGTELGFAAGKIEGESMSTASGIGMEHKLKSAIFWRNSLGRQFGDDMLGYVSAGFGFGRFEMTRSDSNAKASYSATGYTVGLGVEKALSEQLSVYGEYEYANFGKESVQIGGSVTKATPKWHSVNVGLNYRF